MGLGLADCGHGIPDGRVEGRRKQVAPGRTRPWRCREHRQTRVYLRGVVSVEQRSLHTPTSIRRRDGVPTRSNG